MESLLYSNVPFTMYGPSHRAVVLMSLFAAMALVLLGRKARGLSLHHWLPRTLGALIVVSEIVFVLYPVYLGKFGFDWGLPLQLCDITALVIGFGLIFEKAFALEVGCFLGLSATLLTTVTPDLVHDFPHVEFFCFFLTHAMVSVVALYVVFGLDRRPRPRAELHVWLSVNLYGLLAAAINTALGSNYLYICRKPPTGSPFDFMGPWPYYVLVLDLTLGAMLLGLAALFARVPRLRGTD